LEGEGWQVGYPLLPGHRLGKWLKGKGLRF